MYFIFRHKLTDEKHLGTVFWPERQIVLTVTQDHCRCVHIERNDPIYVRVYTNACFIPWTSCPHARNNCASGDSSIGHSYWRRVKLIALSSIQSVAEAHCSAQQPLLHMAMVTWLPYTCSSHFSQLASVRCNFCQLDLSAAYTSSGVVAVLRFFHCSAIHTLTGTVIRIAVFAVPCQNERNAF